LTFKKEPAEAGSKTHSQRPRERFAYVAMLVCLSVDRGRPCTELLHGWSQLPMRCLGLSRPHERGSTRINLPRGGDRFAGLRSSHCARPVSLGCVQAARIP